jgi:peptidoglycan DL-endopeptidase CwlO
MRHALARAALAVIPLLSLIALALPAGAPAPAAAARAGAGPARATLTAAMTPAAALTAEQRHLRHLAHLAHLAQLKAGAAPAAPAGIEARALAWAETQAGTPYEWGATGPYGYDCSGLVFAAYRHADPAWPASARDTYEMLATAGSLLIPVSDPRPGSLAFFGTGHVELYVRAGITFGAQQPGTDVGFHSYGGDWAPTAFYDVR